MAGAKSWLKYVSGETADRPDSASKQKLPESRFSIQEPARSTVHGCSNDSADDGVVSGIWQVIPPKSALMQGGAPLQPPLHVSGEESFQRASTSHRCNDLAGIDARARRC